MRGARHTRRAERTAKNAYPARMDGRASACSCGVEDRERHERLLHHLAHASECIRCLGLSHEQRADVETRLFQIGSWLEEPEPVEKLIGHLRRVLMLLQISTLPIESDDIGRIRLLLKRIGLHL